MGSLLSVRYGMMPKTRLASSSLNKGSRVRLINVTPRRTCILVSSTMAPVESVVRSDVNAVEFLEKFGRLSKRIGVNTNRVLRFRSKKMNGLDVASWCYRNFDILRSVFLAF
jgi:hypothetical protein